MMCVVSVPTVGACGIRTGVALLDPPHGRESRREGVRERVEIQGVVEKVGERMDGV